jgi:hypothetical protein
MQDMEKFEHNRRGSSNTRKALLKLLDFSAEILQRKSRMIYFSK